MANKIPKIPMNLLKDLWYRISISTTRDGDEDVKKIVEFRPLSLSTKINAISSIASLVSIAPKLLYEPLWRYSEVSSTFRNVCPDDLSYSAYCLTVNKHARYERKMTKNWKKFIQQFKPYTMEMINWQVPEVARLGWWLNGEIISSESLHEDL